MNKHTLEGNHHPLWTLCILLTVLPREIREDLMGDLEEGYQRIKMTRNRRAADRYYALQVLSSAGWFILVRLESSWLIRWLALAVILLIAARFVDSAILTAIAKGLSP